MSKYTVRVFKNIQDMDNPAYALLAVVTTQYPLESLTGGWCIEGKTGVYLLPKDTLMTITVEVE